MNKEKTKIIYTLGEAKYSLEADWPDYLQYGFNQNDIPDLIRLVEEDSLRYSDDQHENEWVPLHAWRILGQLQTDKAIRPLINIFETSIEYEDDWAINELPAVMGMIGGSAIEALNEFMTNNNHQEFSRVIAADSLCQIAKRHPDSKNAVLRRYQNYLKQPDTSIDTFNGLLISSLLDLDARELINEIRDLFRQECVDLSIAGDIEDVEIELGFREQRETPKPTIEELFDLAPPIKPDTGDVLEILEYYLEIYGHDEAILDVSEMDGFFVALACAPHTIMPSVWIQAIWGGEEYSPAWETEKEFQEFFTAIMAFYNDTMESMNDRNHEALFLVYKVGEKTHTIVDEWCNGFLKGSNLWGSLPSADAIVVEKALAQIRLFATERGFEELERLNEKEIIEHQEMIEPAVHELFEHFSKQRMNLSQPIVRSEPKIGRNDPCPCGSGKKYKKCCLH